ncbi:translation initiation factor IF-2-like [Mustela putorius furo]|uniref:Translation initiation factor IF-2-like n=1 Tax=Mustela putorius furo TaxID=9669 RepID=A0A8U0S1Q3_MUSPF|nr:translation initiation factor IF-2-like [Mustela putorius furo]
MDTNPQHRGVLARSDPPPHLAQSVRYPTTDSIRAPGPVIRQPEGRRGRVHRRRPEHLCAGARGARPSRSSPQPAPLLGLGASALREAISTFRNRPNKPRLLRTFASGARGRAAPGVRRGSNPAENHAWPVRPRGARTRTPSGREAAEAGEALRDRVRAWRAPPAAPPPQGVATGTEGLASGRVGRGRWGWGGRGLTAAGREGGPREAADSHRHAEAATRRSSVTSGRTWLRGGPSRHPFPPPPPPAAREPRDAAGPLPQPVPLRTRAWRCRAPAAGGGRFKPGGLARAEAALPSASRPGVRGLALSGSALTPPGPFFDELRDPLWSVFTK